MDTNSNKPGLLVAVTFYSVFSALLTLGSSSLLFFGLGVALAFSGIAEQLYFTIFLIISITSGIALLVSAYGLWTMQKWGWQLSLWVYSLTIALGFLNILPILTETSFTIANILYQLFFITINAAIIRYLLKYEVKVMLNVFPYL